MDKQEQSEKLRLIVDVTVRFNSRAARRDVLNDLKRELGAEFSSAGHMGWATAKTGKVREFVQGAGATKEQP